MTSLSEVYGGGVQTVVDRRRRYLAMALFAAGTAMVATAVLLATTGVRSWVSYDIVEARHVAGILAGLGLPAAVVGIFAALPASDEMRAAATIGTSVSVFGVLLFAYAYPSQWLSSEPALALATTAIYTLGMLVTFWCLFVAVATFNNRKSPGGTARVRITDEGKIRLVSSRADPTPSTTPGVPEVPGLGGIGVFGNDPDGNVPTQTNTDDTTDDVETPEAWENVPGTDSPMDEPTQTTTTVEEPTQQSASVDDPATPTAGSDNPTPTSDGGSSLVDESSSQGAGVTSDRGKPDPYCGNCAHFEYVEVADDLDPYCSYHKEFMEDLDACEEWSLNTDST